MHFISITVAIVPAAVSEQLYWVFMWELSKLNKFWIVMPPIILLLLISICFFFLFFWIATVVAIRGKSKTILTTFLFNGCITNTYMKLHSTLSSLCNSYFCCWIHISPSDCTRHVCFPQHSFSLAVLAKSCILEPVIRSEETIRCPVNHTAQGEYTVGLTPCHGLLLGHFYSSSSNIAHASCPALQADSGDVKNETSCQREAEKIPTLPKAMWSDAGYVAWTKLLTY